MLVKPVQVCYDTVLDYGSYDRVIDYASAVAVA